METSLLSRCLKSIIFLIVFAIVVVYIASGVSSIKDNVEDIRTNRPTVEDIVNGNY